jgi:hypothetical protein
MDGRDDMVDYEWLCGDLPDASAPYTEDPSEGKENRSMPTNDNQARLGKCKIYGHPIYNL